VYVCSVISYFPSEVQYCTTHTSPPPPSPPPFITRTFGISALIFNSSIFLYLYLYYLYKVNNLKNICISISGNALRHAVDVLW
jgi:hypothetical protein